MKVNLLAALTLLLSLISHSYSQHETRYQIQLSPVPNGDLSTTFDITTSDSIPQVELLNTVTKSSVVAAAPAFTTMNAVCKIENIVSRTGSHASDVSMTCKDTLTVNGSNPGSNATVEFEIEISGTFDLLNGMIPTGNPKFNGRSSISIRTESSRTVTNREVEVVLRDEIGSGGQRPRVETAQYPFSSTLPVSAFIVVGEPFTIDITFYSSATVTFAEVPANTGSNDFIPIDDLDQLKTTATGRIRCINITSGQVANPSVTSSSGTNYSNLLTKPKPFRIRNIDYEPSTRELSLQWDSPQVNATYRIRRSTDLKTWQDIATNITRSGSTTSFDTTLPVGLQGKQYFRVEEN